MEPANFPNTSTVSSTDGKKLKKLFVTMHIRNVTPEHDSTYGQLRRYECHAFAVGSPLVRRHGFSVNVIRSKFNLKSVKIRVMQDLAKQKK